MSQRQIALKVMEHRGLNIADRVLYGVMRNSVTASLRGLFKRDILVSPDGSDGSVLWASAW